LRLQEAFKCRVSSGRIRSLKDAEKEIRKFRPKIIINCIGATGRNVDDCELDKDRTLLANAFVPIILAEACLRHNIKLIHISSGCIYHFDYKKQKPVTENIIPDYFDLFYSRSKIYSERALDVLSKKFNVLIVRIRIPLDSRPHPKNLLDKLIKYKKVIDVPNSVTYIPDFIKALMHLIKIDAKGIFNIVNKHPLRYRNLMERYKKCSSGFEYKSINLKQLKLVRTNLILSVRKLERSGFNIRDIETTIEECVSQHFSCRTPPA